MSCYHPLLARPAGFTENGKVDYHVIKGLDYSTEMVARGKGLSGFIVPETGEYLPDKIIPCGQCIGCRMDYSRNWANRCMLELQYHDESYFLTLTYDEENVPRTMYQADDMEFESLTLRPKDLQDFIKRVRSDQEYHFGESKLRFYACGEYGSETQRPHYHMIAFSLHLDDLEVGGRTGSGFKYFHSKKLEKLWSHGLVGIAPVTWETCAYVARYILKKQTGKMAEFYDHFNLVPEFVRMSRRPGIAAQWYEDHKDQVYQYDVINLSTEQRGIKFKPPRYFDQKYDIEYPEQMSLIKNNREQVAKALLEAKMADFSGSYLELLQNEEREFHNRIKNLRRSLK